MGQNDATVRAAVEIACWAVSTAGIVLLGLALIVEIVRRHAESSRIVRFSDRLLPTPSRRIALAVVTVASSLIAIAGPRPALAGTEVRDWLTAPTSSAATPPVDDAEPDAEPVPTTTPPTTIAAPTLPRAVPLSPRVAPVVRDPVPTPAPPHSDPSRERPVGPAPESAEAPNPPTSTGATIYTVVSGDCLWSIAQRVLGDGSTNRAIDRGWRAIYTANADAVGSDPNLIHPGLVLTLPALDPTP